MAKGKMIKGVVLCQVWDKGVPQSLGTEEPNRSIKVLADGTFRVRYLNDWTPVTLMEDGRYLLKLSPPKKVAVISGYDFLAKLKLDMRNA